MTQTVRVKAAGGGYARVAWIGSGPQRLLVENQGAAPIHLWTGERIEPGDRATVALYLTELDVTLAPRLDVFAEPAR